MLIMHDYMARIVPTILLHFLHPWRSDVGGTSPWMGEGTSPWMDEVESRQERRPRTVHDYMDVGGRVTQETKPSSNCRERRRMPKPRGAIISETTRGMIKDYNG